MTEEVLEVPKWLKELEEKRERRLKARLGHEAGAGSPCLTCENKCPGLDLHFWRKICKNCKCGKENHDVNDDDIYGWAQFQLLGSKPSKNKKIVLPGRKDAVELDWTPKGQSDTVDLYLKELPVNLLPIKGSTAAQERKQLLQKQIPLHDIDPTLCHALSENEVKQMNDYIAHVKQSSVGIGHIMKLNDLLKNRQSLNPQYQLNRVPMQISQSQHIILQGSDRANIIKNEYDAVKNLNQLTLTDLKENIPKEAATVPVDNRNPSQISNVRDINYAAGFNYVNKPNYANHPHTILTDDQAAVNVTSPKNILAQMSNINYPNHLHTILADDQAAVNVNVPKNIHAQISNINYPNHPHTMLADDQVATNVNAPKDIHGQMCNVNYANHPHRILIDDQATTNANAPKETRAQMCNITYPDQKTHNKLMQPPTLSSLYPNQPYANQLDNQSLHTFKPIRDIHLEGLTTNSPDSYQFSHTIDHVPVTKSAFVNKLQHGLDQRLNLNPNQPISHVVDNQTPLNLQNTDVHSKLHSIHNSPNNYQNSALREVYPDQNVNFKIGDLKGNPELMGLSNMPHYASTKLNTLSDQQIPQKITSIKDLAYSTYNPLSPKNYNPNQLYVEEENLQPTPISVGAINDIEYINPLIKSAEQKQNEFLPNTPRKNVQFDLNDVEILPNCYKCNKMFLPDDFVIGIDRSDALWHSDCFRCTGCNQNLADLLYFYHKESNDIYCGRDYAKIRGIPRCQACDELIFVKEYCLAENSTFHVKHFCCYECDKPLAGQNYVMEELQPLCVPCFENVKAEKCKGCLQVIKPDEKGANLNGVHFHANDECFCCKMCRKPLLGAKILFKNENLYCSSPCFAADK